MRTLCADQSVVGSFAALGPVEPVHKEPNLKGWCRLLTAKQFGNVRSAEPNSPFVIGDRGDNID